MSVTSDDVQPETYPRKAAIAATTERSGKLGPNVTVRATTTAKPTPLAQPRYPNRKRKTPQCLDFDR